MNYYYITGTSRGIGEELALQLLQKSDNSVVGISRKQTINHPNYKHISIDLSDVNAVADFKFALHADAKKICLVNNAGTLGDIKHVGNMQSQDIVKSYNVNVIAPSVLMNTFISTYRAVSTQKIILNISSGAGKNPYDGWAVYCASKAALDMFSRVIHSEQKLENDELQKFQVISVAPGKVDTAMQEQIRAVNADEFSNVNRFIEFKNNNQLSSPKEVALKYIQLLDNYSAENDVVFALKS